MSCNLKNSRQSNAYDRSEYDLKMLEAYNPMNNLPAPAWPGYHSPPYPGQRTEYDMRVQSMWCSKCDAEHPVGPQPGPPQPKPQPPSGSGSNNNMRPHDMRPHHNYSYSY